MLDPMQIRVIKEAGGRRSGDRERTQPWAWRDSSTEMGGKGEGQRRGWETGARRSYCLMASFISAK